MKYTREQLIEATKKEFIDGSNLFNEKEALRLSVRQIDKLLSNIPTK